MAVFKDTRITNVGRKLLTDALANRKNIIFTKLETSDYDYGNDTNVEELITINNVKQKIDISDISQNELLVTIRGVFTNKGLTQSYEVKTIACYAKLEQENEILYSVTRTTTPDTMPAENGINLSTIEVELVTEINNDNGATIEYNPKTLATLKMVDDLKTNVENRFIKKTDLATDTTAGVVTLNKIREIAPQPDLSRNVNHMQGFRIKNETSEYLRISDVANDIAVVPHKLEMYHSNTYIGTLYIDPNNGPHYRASIKGRNSLIRILDTGDLDAINNILNKDTVKSVRFGEYVQNGINSSRERVGHVVTNVTRQYGSTLDSVTVGFRPLQIYKNGGWFNVSFI